jgi:hypothetical protein
LPSGLETVKPKIKEWTDAASDDRQPLLAVSSWGGRDQTAPFIFYKAPIPFMGIKGLMI